MKIAIITIHNIHNFGSVFQAYALCKYLNDCGYDAKVIDYNPPYFRHKSLRTCIGQCLNLREYLLRKKKFGRFVRKNIPLSARTYLTLDELKKAPPIVDVYIAGGDQLWNSYHACGKDDAYKLSFIDGNKISYGTSMGRSNFASEELEMLVAKLWSFKHVAVRESSSVNLLKSAGIDAIQVADPVLLLNADDYRRFLTKPPIEKYLFVYLVTASELLNETISYTSKKLGLKVVLYAGLSKKCECDYFLKDLGPEEVLSYIKNADFVLSASFHATLFSIMFHKQFATLLPNENTNERIEDLLRWTMLKSRIIRGAGGLVSTLFEPINYINTDLSIEEMVYKSKEYLNSSLVLKEEYIYSEN